MSSQDSKGKPLVENWPMGPEVTRDQLKKVQRRLDRYRAALRLANSEIERRNQSILALSTFAYQASRVNNLNTLAKTALVQALKTIATNVGAIVLVDTDSKELKLGVQKGLSQELIQILTGQQLGKGAVALMPHLVAGSGALLEYQSSTDEMERHLLEAGGLTSLVSLPLQFGPRLMGALLIGLQADRTFSPAELAFLMAVSQEMVLALEGLNLREGLWQTASVLLDDEPSTLEPGLQTINEIDVDVQVSPTFDLLEPLAQQPAEDDLENLLAGMMEAEDEVQRQNIDLQSLNSIAESLNRTLNLKEVLQHAVEQTQNLLNTEATWLYLVNDAGYLEMKANVSLSEAYVRGMHLLEVGDQVEGQVAAENQARFIASVDSYQHKFWVDRERLRAIAAVPITRPDKAQTNNTASHVIGVLATARRNAPNHAWSPREMRMLVSVANQLALAIDNARLYAKVQEAEVGLRTGQEVLQTINDMILEKNAFLEGVVQDELQPVLSSTLPMLEELSTQIADTLSKGQQQKLAALQTVLYRLSMLTKQATDVSEVLDSEFERLLKSKDTEDNYGRSAKPVRLEKKDPASPQPVDQPVADNVEPAAPEIKQAAAAKTEASAAKADSSAKPEPMSYEDAVAAGLVPGHIVDRESD